MWFLNHVANWVLHKLGVEAASEAEEAHNEDEIRILMEESHKHGYIDKTELTYLDNVFDFSDRRASDIMVPRTDMICLYLEDSWEDNIKTALEERMTRYPICDEDKDHIIGFLHIKDLLRSLNAGERPDLRSLARDVLLVPESLPISRLLRMLQKHRSQLAVLVDEYGGTAGMVTVEDILEEIVGEIHDEYDENEEENIRKINPREYIVEGSTNLDDLNDSLDLHLESEDYDSVGGFIIEHLDRLPEEKDEITTPDGIRMVVEKLDKNRVEQVHIYLPESVATSITD